MNVKIEKLEREYIKNLKSKNKLNTMWCNVMEFQHWKIWKMIKYIIWCRQEKNEKKLKIKKLFLYNVMQWKMFKKINYNKIWNIVSSKLKWKKHKKFSRI